MVALVVAGGGMRTAYAAGVLRSFQDVGIRFDGIYGTSAGGAAGAWYAARRADGFEASFEHASDPGILDWRRAAKRLPVLDLTKLVDELYPSLGFDARVVQRAPHPTIVTGTVVTTGATRYLDLRRDPVHESLRATMALPIVAGPPVLVAGTLLVDGGVSDPIPVQRAIRDGHRDIWVILSRRDAQYRPEPRVAAWLVRQRHPALGRLAAEHHTITSEALRALNDPPEGVTVHVLRPSKDTGLSRLTRHEARLKEAIRLGRAEALEFLTRYTRRVAA